VLIQIINRKWRLAEAPAAVCRTGNVRRSMNKKPEGDRMYGDARTTGVSDQRHFVDAGVGGSYVMDWKTGL
jgi:hypothetical protein